MSQFLPELSDEALFGGLPPVAAAGDLAGFCREVLAELQTELRRVCSDFEAEEREWPNEKRRRGLSGLLLTSILCRRLELDALPLENVRVLFFGDLVGRVDVPAELGEAVAALDAEDVAPATLRILRIFERLETEFDLVVREKE